MVKTALYLYCSKVHFDFRKGARQRSTVRLKVLLFGHMTSAATPLADKREIGRLMGSLHPIERIWLVCCISSQFLTQSYLGLLKAVLTDMRPKIGRNVNHHVNNETESSKSDYRCCCCC